MDFRELVNYDVSNKDFSLDDHDENVEIRNGMRDYSEKSNVIH